MAGLVLPVFAQSEGGAVSRREATALPAARQMHGAAVLGDYLYVIGGAQEVVGWVPSVIKARILPDKTLGPWEETTALPEPRAYIENSTIALNDVLYVVGGFNGTTNENKRTVYWTKPMYEGHLAPWNESAPFLNTGLDCLTVVSAPGYLHVIGGQRDDDEPSNSVISGVVASDGSIARWEMSPSLPQALWFHNAVAISGRVWVWGGLTGKLNTSTSNRIYSAPIQSNGHLGDWDREQVELPVPQYSAAGASAGAYLMSFCPRLTGGGTTHDVWFAVVGAKGLGAWQQMATPLSACKYFPAAPDYRRGSIYIPGGRIDDKSLENRVFYFSLSEAARRAYVGAPPSVTGAADTTAADDPSQTPAVAGMPTPISYTFLAQTRLAAGAVPGFVTFDQARSSLGTPPPRPLLLYFNIQGSRPCAQQVEILKQPEFAALSQQAIFAWIDVREYPQLVQQLGIYRAPTWILYNSRGVEQGRSSGTLTLQQLAAGVAAAK